MLLLLSLVTVARSVEPEPVAAPSVQPTAAPDERVAHQSLQDAAKWYRNQGLITPTPGGPWARLGVSKTIGIVEVSGGPALLFIGWIDGNLAAVASHENDVQWAGAALLMGGGFELVADGAARLVLTKPWRNALRAEAWGVAPGRYPTPERAERAFHVGMAVTNAASGALLAAGGVGLLGMSSSLKHDYPLQPDGDYAAATGGTLLAEGLLGIGTGAVQLLTIPDRDATLTWTLAPVLDGRHAGMQLGGTF